MQPINVMITGAGSGVGQGIIKSLKISTLSLNLISVDINPYQAGLYVTNQHLLIPKLEDEKNPQLIIDLIVKHNINVLLIGSEYDLSFFSRYKEQIETESNCQIIVPCTSSLNLAHNKWKTIKFLKSHNIAYPKTYLPLTCSQAKDYCRDVGYPVLIKPSVGTSSRDVVILKSEAELLYWFARINNPIIQEYLIGESKGFSDEYTCSLFKSKDGKVLGPFTARRTLRNGNSWVIEVKPFLHLHPILLKISEQIDYIGSLNIQLMDTPKGPIPFELNMRFSGTTAIRSYYGFNEPEMAIRSYYLNETIMPPTIREGYALRYLEEIFIENTDLHNSENIVAEKMSHWF